MSEPADPDDALMLGLGRTVRAASQLDHSLRMLLCALTGSKYAAILAGGEMTGSLLDSCEALLKAHRELAPEHKDKLAALLRDGRKAARDRNRLVHDVWASGPEGMFLVRSERRTHELATKPVTLEEVEAVQRDLTRIGVQLVPIMFEAFGPDATTMEAQLRWEDYHLSLSPVELAAMDERRRRALLDKERGASGDQHEDEGEGVK